MSPLWRKALPLPSSEEVAREAVVKSSLTKGLGQAIRNLQHKLINADEHIASGDETTNTICFILEAIFIHGLKDTFIRRVTAILSGNVDKIPEPNFWPFLLIFTHKDVITQINNLTNISTEIGHCRAWLRISLNDGLLESYLSAIVKDKKSLQYYYSHTAYLRDPEQPDILRRYIEGLNVLNFKLSYNLQNLNDWTATPLMLAGIWAPPIAPEPVTTGVDVVSYFSDDGGLTPIHRRRIKPNELHLDSSGTISTTLPNLTIARSEIITINAPYSDQDSVCSSPASCPDPPPPPPVNGGSQYSMVSAADESFTPVSESYVRNIEETVVHDVHNSSGASEVETSSNQSTHCWRNETLISPAEVVQTPSDAIRGITDGVPEAETGEELDNQPHVGNSLIGMMGWSSLFNDESSSDAVQVPGSQCAEQESFQSLLKNYSPASGSVIRTPNFSEIVEMIAKVEGQSVGSPARIANSISPMDEATAASFGFEVIPKTYSVTSKSVDAQTQALINLMGTIQNEKGLNAQNFQCKGCSRPVGMIYGKARVCDYNGAYYCSECHQNDEHVIPARIIHNWDFKKYKVSKQSMRFLEQIEEEPLIDIRKMNSSLYHAIEELGEILSLRTQLSYLRSYLFTCRESVVEELRRKMWPKEYLYEHVHLYSLSDLQQIPGGNFSQLLGKVISFASKHVAECRLCSQKGFICEICSNPKVIYPFQMELTYRCEKCPAVYHSRCMNDKTPCPKCMRRQKYQGQQEYLWTMED